MIELMNKTVLESIVKQLCDNKTALEKVDGHDVKSISVGQDYDPGGNIVDGISVRYSSDVLSGTFALVKFVEDMANEDCLWFRYSPKGLFVYFK